jgi:CheY-like chemotaxis protein
MAKERTNPANLGRILVVEDSASSRKLLHDVLLRLGVELPNLRVAPTILEAQVLFTQWRPDVAIIDVELPATPPPGLSGAAPVPSPQDPKNGAELAARFRSRNPAVKIVVCSASDPSDPRVAPLLRSGEVEFVMKPVVASRIEDVLAKLGAPGRAAPVRPTD